MKKVVITQENVENVELKDLSVSFELDTSFDTESRKAGLHRKAQITVNLDGASFEDVLKRASSSFRIAINSALKTRAFDGESYVKMIEDADNKFSFSYDEIGGKSANPVTTAEKAWAKMTKEQRKAFKKLMGE